jgi:predicted nucleic acid-binding protein
MTESTFVDTNILVYARDAGQQTKQVVAQECLRQLWQQRAGRISIQVLSEYYVTLTRKLKPGLSADTAWDDIDALMAWNPQPIDRAVLTRAREIERRYRTSWWDATIVAAAHAQGCRILLSEDFQHGMAFDQLKVRNPFASELNESNAGYTDYAATIRPRPRHRPRGRPRKSP